MKKSILLALESNDLETVVSFAKKNRRSLSHLVRAAYDKGTLVGWRAIKAIGFAARELVRTDYEFLRETVRKLLWSLSDESGGIGWAAPEILGEIASADLERFRDIIPLIAELYDIEEKVFRPGVLYAFGRIAEVEPALIAPFKPLVMKALSDDDPLTRLYALELALELSNQLGAEDLEILKSHIQKLLSDRSEVWVYKNDAFANIVLGEYAGKVLKDLSGKDV